MKTVLTGGGTAGHINPALALAEELRERGAEVLYAGTPQGVEAQLVPAADIPFIAFEAQGFDRQKPLTLITSICTILRSTRAAKKWLRRENPDVVVCFGGYVCLPVGRAAKALHIPLVIHEQNSVMGMSNAYFARSADFVCLTYACAAGKTPAHRVRVTGNPVRKSVIEAKRSEGRAMLGVPDDALLLLVFGGSLGARHLNHAFALVKDELLARENLYIVHVSGPKEYETVIRELALSEQEAKRWKVFDYQHRMGLTLAACDCIVSRAGASSLAEIAARAIPAILVPFPYATADHQTINAQELVEAGCAMMIADSEVETEAFRTALFSLVDDDAMRLAMHENALNLKAVDAARLLADTVSEAASKDHVGESLPKR